MRYIIFAFIAVLLLAFALPAQAERPYWTFGLKGGYFFPNLNDWDDHYGDDGFWTGGIEIGWKMLRQLELNTSITYGEDEGKAFTASGQPSIDELDYRHLPIHVSLLYRLIFDEDQFLVPYIGGGYTHLFYWQELGSDENSGDQNGYHVRGGVQILLDRIEPKSARTLFESAGIYNSYLFFEGIYSEVDDFGDEDVDLGGWHVFGGLLLEF